MLAIVYEGREYLVEGFKFERNRKFIMFKKVPGTRVVNEASNVYKYHW